MKYERDPDFPAKAGQKMTPANALKFSKENFRVVYGLGILSVFVETSMKKKKVLFICKDGAIRSQLAAAFLNAYFGDRYEACYAGTEPAESNPYAVKVMQEIGIDISACPAKKIENLPENEFDCIITLCDYAQTHLPTLPKHKKQLHQGFKYFCLPRLCENAKKSQMCFPGQPKALQGCHHKIKEIAKDDLLAFRYLREAIFDWVEHEMVF